ncbi:hydrogenase maturation protease [Denitrovibrio acetiphilus DSM 12809]|uniref:Hydrogenase maturation protease n=1 Tax=Denitrovibrio acetiphilus (strain DSM 12809 / NBRC 114555 / N2460) TaxID=522772 RepID=D4H7J2_DENA2|nr:hydrogenase maturation protease [Denitrovibrio acetiphilus]ADD67991.1 hydrogenase maturation protease [Denitrovibrio acetiphilus DSM 12809]
MQTVVFGAGNLLLSDEGLGVHLIKHMNKKYEACDDVEFYDAGTMGILAIHKLEETQHVIIVDSLEAEGEPGELRVYEKDDIMLDKIPAKMSPHQIGLQEVLTLSELRGKAPKTITFYGVIPESLESSVELSSSVQKRVGEIDQMIVSELNAMGIELTQK